MKTMLSPKAMVIRDGREMIIPFHELVSADLLVYQRGDTIPADVTISDRVGLSDDESVLTGGGESVEVGKNAKAPKPLQAKLWSQVMQKPLRRPSDRKRMSVLSRHVETCEGLIKDASEAIRTVSTRLRTPTGDKSQSGDEFTRIRQACETLAVEGLRVIALAKRQTSAKTI